MYKYFGRRERQYVAGTYHGVTIQKGSIFIDTVARTEILTLPSPPQPTQVPYSYMPEI
jgi:hypothetical protein